MSEDLHGEYFTQDFGCFTFMPNEVLGCICNATHYNLIPSVSALAKETHWHLAREHGPKVRDAAYTPSTIPTTNPGATAPKTHNRELTCSSCNKPGHSSKFFE